MATEPKADDVKTVEKTVDERAVKLANASELAISASAKAESDIAASHSLLNYAIAGRAHLESIKCCKASIDYECEKRGVPTSWTAASYDDVIDTITRRIRATNPELFENFDALKEKPSPPSNNRERIHTRVLVAMVADSLVSLVGDRVWEVPYRIVANYLRAERVFSFSKANVDGELKVEHAEFLKVQLGLLVDKKSTTAGFLNALQGHFNELDKAAEEAAASHLTPEERTKKKAGAEATKKAVKTQKQVSTVREKLTEYLGIAMNGQISPEEIAKMVKESAKTAGVVLPLGKQLNPVTVTVPELSSFLEKVIARGGATIEERRKLRRVIMQYGSELASKQREKAASRQASNGAVNAMAN